MTTNKPSSGGRVFLQPKLPDDGKNLDTYLKGKRTGAQDPAPRLQVACDKKLALRFHTYCSLRGIRKQPALEQALDEFLSRNGG